MRVGRSTLGGPVLHIIVDPGPVEDPREFLTWRSRGLRIVFPVLAACRDEAAVARLVEGAVPEIARGAVVEIGLVATTSAQPSERLGRAINRPWRRMPPESQSAPYGAFGQWAPEVKPIESGEIQSPETDSRGVGAPDSARGGAEQAPLRQRGPRLGRRVPEKELRTLLRGVVIREGLRK